MTCTEIRPFLHACFDGELDIVRTIDTEQHVKNCPACSARLKSMQSLRAALQKPELALRAPAALRERIQQTIPEPAVQKSPSQSGLWRWLAIAATAFALLTLVVRPSQDEQLTDDLVSSHVRSLMAGHLTDVASTDQHTVKPWFDGKLDFAPAVRDFAAQGFPLAGGRLDYINGRPVAALVYQHNKHFINVFVWPSSETVMTAGSRRGYSVLTRGVGGFRYGLVSDMDAAGLEQLADLLGK